MQKVADYHLTQEMLLAHQPEFFGEGFSIGIMPYVPVEQVDIAWLAHMAQSVVPIFSNGPEGGWMGTAFYQDGGFVTAQHCIEDRTHIWVPRMRLHAPPEKIGEDAVRIPAKASLPWLPSFSQAAEAQLFIIGYPGTLQGGPYVSWNGYLHNDLVRIRSEPGSSGSPIISYQGEVIGVWTGNHGVSRLYH